MMNDTAAPFESLLDVRCKTSLYGQYSSYRLLSVIVEETALDIQMETAREHKQRSVEQGQQQQQVREGVQVIVIPQNMLNEMSESSSSLQNTRKRWIDDDLSLESNESWDSELFDDIDADEYDIPEMDEVSSTTSSSSDDEYVRLDSKINTKKTLPPRLQMTPLLAKSNTHRSNQQLRRYAGRAA